MVTIPGNKFARLGTSFDNSSSFRELVPDTVYLDVEKWDWFAHNPINISLLGSVFFAQKTSKLHAQARSPGLLGFRPSGELGNVEYSSQLTLLPAIPCRICLKIVAEFSDKALSRPSTRLAEGANGSAGDIVSHRF
jgi:hypothetical protein